MDYARNRIVRTKTIEVLALARSIYSEELPSPEIKFSNRMTRCAGTYTRDPRKFNPHILTFSAPIIVNNDVDAFCHDTVIHEVAHFVDRVVNGSTGHNQRFYNVMRKLGNNNPTRCHSFKTVSNRKTFSYRCECCGEIMELSSIRHNKVYGTGRFYSHNKCGRPAGKLVYIGH